MSKAILLVGRRGAGKTTLARHLVAKHGARMLRSVTTRARRQGEDDFEYDFVDNAEFEQADTVERVEYKGNRYGVLRPPPGFDGWWVAPFLPDGAADFRRNCPGWRMYFVCVAPPSLAAYRARAGDRAEPLTHPDELVPELPGGMSYDDFALQHVGPALAASYVMERLLHPVSRSY